MTAPKFAALPFLLFLWILAWPATGEEPPKVFSGKVDLYQDQVQGYKIKIPVEFTNTAKGMNTSWEGPRVANFPTSIHINAVVMAGVHPQALYDGVIRSKKADPTVTAVTPVKYEGKLKGKGIYGFTCREAEVKPGTRDKKDPSDHHRWYLFVWGNDTAYQVMVACSYEGLTGAGKELPAVFAEVLKSFALIPIK